ncbi:terminase large subunit [Clostridium botulinum]|uniref:terminase large subunit n=1 Tax=Clostridium botulinum TaxID=1491 RepID=UPI0019689966|nr:terminase TerL endonuclease subunit [Clostridium botulinum]MBN1043725.1 terminase large subunit [Clostridium botulinum]
MDRVTQFCYDVLEDKIVAGKLEKLACQRHLDDLERAKLAPYKYEFDIDKALDIINFAETLTIAEGEFEEDDEEEENLVTLYPFQAFILGSLNGWVAKGTGYRRFRTSYIQLGRQNGKSFLNGILAAYYGNFIKYRYGQIYCVATKKDQAKIVFNEVVKFIEADAELAEFFKVKDYESVIECNTTHSSIKALSKDTKSIDGFRPLLGIVDEYHAHKTNQMYKLLEGGIKKMKQALISIITTAGFELNSPCYKQYEYCKGILEGLYTNDTQFVFITQMDEEDDIWKSENWLKSNPTLQYDREALENMIPISNQVRAMGGEDLRDFLTKQLNIWVQFTDDQYIKLDDWKKGACDLTLEDFKGYECNVGLDLSSGGDLTSFALEFIFEEDGVKKYFIYTHSFIPKKRVEEHIKTDDAPYDIWIKQGLLTVTETNDGIKTDYKYIIKKLKELIEKYDFKIDKIGYDPHNADTFLTDLEEVCPDCVEIYQSHKFLNDCTDDFRLEVQAGNVYYNRNEELLTFSIVNAKTVSNGYGEIKIDKDKRQKRIDPVDAIIDAHKLTFKIDIPTGINESVSKYLQMFGEEV